MALEGLARRRHISIAARFEPGKMQRIDEPTYPPKAVREAVINAIAHRDYTIVGGSVIVSIFDDRLEVTSHGKLPAGIKISDLRIQHASQPRNELIAHTLFRRGIIETGGTGTQEMIKACKELNMPEPEFIEHGNTFSVIFKAKEPISTLRIVKEPIALSTRQEQILKLLSTSESLSSQEILDKLGDSIAARTLRRELTVLKNKGYILSQGKGSLTTWLIKK